MSDQELQLRVDCLRREADGVISVTLAEPSGLRLPEWDPGSHLQIRLRSGRTRQYSIFAGGGDGNQYWIAVKDNKDGRGGSREIHSSLKLGDLVAVSPPANNFRLEPALHYIFIAGGIGITPILPMAEAVLGNSSFHLYYCGRTRSSMSLLREVGRLPQANVTIASSDAGRLSLKEIVGQAKSGSHIYACGPSRLLDELSSLVGDRPDIALRIERFEAPEQVSAPSDANNKSFELVMNRSGRRIVIPPDSTVLAELLKEDPSIRYSCCEGFCGTCETKVLEGRVDHRDLLLTEDERLIKKTMMICVSRALSDVLVLDI